jgi:hypothetical protein
MVVGREKAAAGEVEDVRLGEIDRYRAAGGSVAADGCEAEAKLAGDRIINVAEVLLGLGTEDYERFDPARAVWRKLEMEAEGARSAGRLVFAEVNESVEGLRERGESLRGLGGELTVGRGDLETSSRPSTPFFAGS